MALGSIDMSERVRTESIDALLLVFLRSVDKDESDRLLTQLVVEHAGEIIKQVIRRELDIALDNTQYCFNEKNAYNIQNAKDIYGDVIEKLLRRLSYIKTSIEKQNIDDFSSYIAVTTQNACYDYLRLKYPNRWRLKNKLRYILSHHNDFAGWQNDKDEILAGLVAWKGLNKASDHSKAMEIILSLKSKTSNLALVDTMAAVFQYVGSPIRLEDLTHIIAQLSEIIDRSGKVENHQSDPKTGVEQHAYLNCLWREICQLPLRQRVALLLNLRDESGYGIALFCYNDIANLHQIAEVVELSSEKLAAIWNELPWDDATIAAHLGVTRQQVINLRKAARERLAFRMKLFLQAKV